MENIQKIRDYNKDPIIVIDRMPEIGFWFFMAFAMIPFGSVLLWMHLTNREIDWIHVAISLIIMYVPTYFYLKNKMATTRTIFLMQQEIVRTWDNEILKVSWDNIKSVKKSFIDFYDKRQRVFVFIKFLIPIYAPIMLLIAHPYLIFIKFIYKIFSSFSNTSIYDTVVLFGTNDEMIAIFIPTNEIKNELKEYFLLKEYDIDNLPMFYSVSYTFDGINKKDQ
jgi:hypothetical protein